MLSGDNLSFNFCTIVFCTMVDSCESHTSIIISFSNLELNAKVTRLPGRQKCTMPLCVALDRRGWNGCEKAGRGNGGLGRGRRRYCSDGIADKATRRT